MTRHITDAEVRLFDPGASAPKATVGQERIQQAQVQRRLGTLVDQGSVTLYNDDGQFSDTLSAGDRVDFLVQFRGDSTLSRRFTGIARVPTIQPSGGRGTPTVSVSLDDLVFRTLSFRTVFAQFDDLAVDDIIRAVVSDAAPELTTNISQLDTSTSITANGTEALELVSSLVALGDGVARQDGDTLIVEPLSGIQTDTSLDRATDIGIPEVGGSDDEMANEVRVSGGTDTAIDDQQPTQTTTTTVTASSTLTTTISTRKSEVARVDIFTDRTGSDEDLIVRLQQDDGTGAPVAPNDPQSDIAQRRLSAEFIEQGGLTTFLLPDHTLPEPEPVLIIQSSGASGQLIGIDGNGEPRYDAFFEFPVEVRSSDGDSVAEFRRRETLIQDDSISSLAEANDRAETVLQRRARPRREFSAVADSLTAHQLAPGDGLSLDWTDLNTTGPFVVSEVRDQFDGTVVETDIKGRSLPI